MGTLTLRQALGVLAKSSPFSVSTVSQRAKDVYDELKAYLYVEQDIERDFKKLLTSVRSNEIIFLCGSSGDGKSEILARAYETYHNKFRFHLDATHSFQPHQSAIEALDQLFDEAIADPRPLVLGINIGMLANFAKEGASRHHYIRTVIDGFLESGYRSFDRDDAPVLSSAFIFSILNSIRSFNFARMPKVIRSSFVTCSRA